MGLRWEVGMKNKDVCKGCKYAIRYSGQHYYSMCGYGDATGKSRIIVENANGGIKKDSCICYESGKRRRKAIGG